YFLSLVLLKLVPKLAPGIISCLRQLHREINEALRLAVGLTNVSKKPVGREGLDGGYCTPLRGGAGANHRTGRQTFFAYEVARFRQDLVGLGELRGSGSEIRKRYPSFGVGERSQSCHTTHRITRLVMPKRKVVYLDPADTQQDSQN